LFGQFNKYLRQSFEEYVKKYSKSSFIVLKTLHIVQKYPSPIYLKKESPDNDPSKFGPFNVLLSGSTMKISKLKEIVKNVFNFEPKIIGKETIAKGCMLMANLFANKNTNIQIFDYLSYDLYTIGDL
jgi:hypothetical protein